MRIVIRKPRWLRRRRDDDLPPPSRRQRLIVAAAAVVVTAALGAALLAPQLELMRAKQRAALPKPCAPGQTSGCVGGTMNAAIVAPGPSTASAASAPSSAPR
ncbi:MAG: hypothetical protein OEU94_09185 [Aquincola sp.]|nr:hypothetical protein [Aquincola sp.]MDH4290485.1 hypothetical protein [Aquincola sp.]